MAGVLFIVLGGLVGALFASAAFSATADPAKFMDRAAQQMADALHGGHLNLTVLDGGVPVSAQVTATSPKGIEVASTATNSSGQVRLDLRESAAATVRIDAGGRNVTATFFIIEGRSLDATLDLQGPAPKAWDGFPTTSSALSVSLWVLTGIAVFVVVGGIAAVRLRPYVVAWVLPLPFVLLTGILAFSFLNLGFLVAFALPAGGLAVIVAGRRCFR
jgi:hypothetical protein